MLKFQIEASNIDKYSFRINFKEKFLLSKKIC